MFFEYYEKKRKDFRGNDPHLEGLFFFYFSFGVIENDLYHYFSRNILDVLSDFHHPLLTKSD
jgi:hypothetical protein